MKRTALLITLLVLFKITNGQTLVIDTEFISLDKFKLGDSVLKFGDDIKLTPTQIDNVKSYQYYPALKKPLEVANCFFNIISLNFDESDKLSSLFFTKFYNQNNFKQESRSEYEKLVTYMNNAVNIIGEHKVYYHNIHEGYEWTVGNSILIVDIQETGKVESTSVGISLKHKR